MTKQDFMREAIELAVRSVKEDNTGPFGAVVVKDGQIVGRGNNQVTANNDPTAHAEVTAIRDACRNLGTFKLDGCELYSSCEPCPMCLASIYWARIDRVYFSANQRDAAAAGFDDAFLYEQVALPYEKRSLPMTLLLQDEGQKPFQAWNANENKIPY